MTPDERPKQKFEPPPWEAEAFERFRQEQERFRAAEELENELRTVREPTAGVTTHSEPQTANPAQADPAVVPDDRVEAMLAELRAEEVPVTRVGPTLLYSAVAFLGTMGLFVVVAGLMMFTRAGSTEGAATLLVAMTSLVMLAAGGGCVAGAVMLYRKYHQ